MACAGVRSGLQLQITCQTLRASTSTPRPPPVTGRTGGREHTGSRMLWLLDRKGRRPFPLQLVHRRVCLQPRPSAPSPSFLPRPARGWGCPLRRQPCPTLPPRPEVPRSLDIVGSPSHLPSHAAGTSSWHPVREGVDLFLVELEGSLRMPCTRPNMLTQAAVQCLP